MKTIQIFYPQMFFISVLRERKKVSFLRNPQSSSFLFPGRRAVTSPIQRNPDPLIRQQVEWNVKQVGFILFLRRSAFWENAGREIITITSS